MTTELNGGKVSGKKRVFNVAPFATLEEFLRIVAAASPLRLCCFWNKVDRFFEIAFCNSERSTNPHHAIHHSNQTRLVYRETLFHKLRDSPHRRRIVAAFSLVVGLLIRRR